MKLKKKFIVPGIAFLMVPGAVFSQDLGQWRLSTGIDISSGDYGSNQDTEVTYLPLNIRYRQGRWDFDASFSHVSVEGSSTFIPGEGVFRRRGPGGGPVPVTISNNESGIGDVWLGAGYFVNDFAQGAVLLDLGARLKIPTADEDKGLGTGEVDTTIQAEFYKPMNDMTPFVTVGYKFKGSSRAYPLDDVPFFSIGSDYTLSDVANAGLSLDWQESLYAGGSDYLDLGAYYRRSLQNDVSLTLYGYKGLQDGSPDLGLGIQLAFDL